MNGRKAPRSVRERGVASLGQHLTLVVLVLLAAAPILLAAALVPRAAVLPAFSLAAIAMALIAGAVAWWRKASRHAGTVTLWDVAGAFMLIGCAAAMMAEPENLLQVFGHTQKP